MSISRKKKNKGFTIIELVAVMAIMAILAAVLIPNVTGYITEARKFEVIEQARKVIIAAEAIKIKSPAAITNDDFINSVVTKSSGLLTTGDVNLLNPENMKVKDCYNLVDVENYTFTINGDKSLGTITKIT